MSLAKKM
jgi:hypothetical protein